MARHFMHFTLLLLLLSVGSGAWGSQTPSGGSPSSTIMGKECDPRCIERGNCNRETGTCECMIGFNGPACETPILPACQASANDLPFWGNFYPKSCECYTQAAAFFCKGAREQGECEITGFQARLSGSRCYTVEVKPREEQWSMFPAEGTRGIKWHEVSGFKGFPDEPGKAPVLSFSPLAEEKGRKAINLWGHPCKAIPSSECPKNCSMKGSCIKDCFPNFPPKCECHKGWTGPACEETDESICLNGCSGRGKCIRSFCHCEPGYFGMDCSRTKGYPARPESIPEWSKPRIYIYELPQSISSNSMELDDNLADAIPIYSAYLRFLVILLKDWTVRTENPWEANLFFIPAFTYSYSSNAGDPSHHLKGVVRYIDSNFPYYKRNQGKDHFFILSGDQGACRMAPEPFGKIIRLVHFGFHQDQVLQGPALIHHKPPDTFHSCFNPTRDVMLAPYNEVGFAEARQIFARVISNNGVDLNRTLLFFFAGGTREQDLFYSGGVRQAVNKLLTELNRSKADGLKDIIFIEGYSPDYRKLFNTAKFCLAPYGSGFGIRLSISMVHGCIPVIIQDHVYQPFEDVIPYDEMSVRVPKIDIPNLISILRAVGDEEQRVMRLRMAEHFRAFTWDPEHGGQAYNYTVKSLHKRLVALWGELWKK